MTHFDDYPIEQAKRFKKVKDAQKLLIEAIDSVVKEPQYLREYQSLQIALASINVLVEDYTKEQN